MPFNQSHEIQSKNSRCPVLIWACGLDQSHDFFNQDWLDFTGSEISHNINDGWFHFIHPDDLSLFQLTYEKAQAAQQSFQIEFRLKKHDGTYRWMQCHAVPRPDLDGEFTGLIATNIDIHEQLVERSEQITYEESYERILDCITQGIWDWMDVNSDEQWWSPHFYELLGYRDQEIQASFSIFKRLIHPDDLERTLQVIDQALKTILPFDTDFRLRIKGGDYHWFRTTAKIIRNPNSGVVRMTGSTSDIHRQVLAEEELKKERKLAEQAQLEKDTFLALMSQEVRTPLSAILGFSEILNESSDDPETQTAAEIIHTNGQSLLDTINDFLDLSKIKAGLLDIEILDCCPVKVIENIHAYMTKKADSKGLLFNIQYETEIPETIKSDPIRLKQILTTVIGTAIKLTHEGSVTLCVETTSADNGTQQLTFRVTNTETELSSEQFSHLFNPSRLTDELLTHPVSGLGLGLAVSKHLTEMLGGSIQVKSQDASSTTVEFTIPAGDLTEVKMEKFSASKRLEEIKAKKASHDFLNQNCHILLVEDGIYNQRFIKFLLTRAGAEITIVENGQEAINELQKSQGIGDPIGYPYDLILMDIQMPVLDGYSTTRKIRALGYTKPIIALTIHAMDSDRQKCFDAGCDEYMSKPLERKKLISIINSFLKKSQSRNLVPQ